MIKLNEIAAAAASHFGINLEQMLSGRRSTTYVMARRMCCALARQLTPHTYPQIAEAMHLADHGTVRHHVNAHPALMQRDHHYASHFAELQASLGVMPRVARPSLRIVES